MPKQSKLIRLELAIENDQLIGAQATFQDIVHDGETSYALGNRTERVSDVEDPAFAGTVQALLGEAVVASQRTVDAYLADKARAETERDDAVNQLATMQAEFNATKDALQQVGQERDSLQVQVTQLESDAVA